MKHKFYLFQPRVWAKNNYVDDKDNEQLWTPWFALILAPVIELFGYEAILIDARVDCYWKKSLSCLSDQDILGISVMTGKSISDAKEASIIAKKKNALVIWGGPHVTLFPNDTLQNAPLDVAITSFGCEALYNLLSLINGYSFYDEKEAPNIHFKNPFKSIEISKNKIAKPLRSCEKYFQPSTTLIHDWEVYINVDKTINNRVINYVSAEGCICNCAFCSEPLTSKKRIKTYPISMTIETMGEIIRCSKANGVKFHDPNFFINDNRAKRLSEHFSRYIQKPWAAAMHPLDLINYSEYELQTYSSQGLKRLLIGLESPVQEIINYSRKNYDSNKILDMAAKLKNANIVGMFTFIVGWPNQDSSHYQKTIDCAYKIKEIGSSHQCKIHFLEPWPGSKIFNEIEKQGFKLPCTLDEWENIDYYLAQYSMIHDYEMSEVIRNANKELCPYTIAE